MVGRGWDVALVDLADEEVCGDTPFLTVRLTDGREPGGFGGGVVNAYDGEILGYGEPTPFGLHKCSHGERIAECKHRGGRGVGVQEHLRGCASLGWRAHLALHDGDELPVDTTRGGSGSGGGAGEAASGNVGGGAGLDVGVGESGFVAGGQAEAEYTEVSVPQLQ